MWDLTRAAELPRTSGASQTDGAPHSEMKAPTGDSATLDALIKSPENDACRSIPNHLQHAAPGCISSWQGVREGPHGFAR